MKRLAVLCLGSLALVPAYSFGKGSTTISCGAVHFVRAMGTELRSTTISFRNFDLENEAIIERVTFRNGLGEVVHDSGPAIGVAHPPARDYPEDHPAGFDFTVVPPGANNPLSTNDIWGSNNIPLSPGKLSNYGQNMSVTIQFSKRGDPDLLAIGVATRSRERLAGGGQGAERSRNSSLCREVPSR